MRAIIVSNTNSQLYVLQDHQLRAHVISNSMAVANLVEARSRARRWMARGLRRDAHRHAQGAQRPGASRRAAQPDPEVPSEPDATRVRGYPHRQRSRGSGLTDAKVRI